MFIIYYLFQNSSGMHQRLQSSFQKIYYIVSRKRLKGLSCFNRLLNLVNEQLSILEFKYNFN